jgi:light-regulated signal transduction histidine kinase (bacteriophytochrome)
LEQRVLERTEELLRSNDELAQFAYIASHDLQEPLRTVSIYTELLSMRYGDVLQGDAQEFMGYVVTNAQRMEQLIRDLLDFSRLDARGSDYFGTADCEAALDEALNNLHLRIDEASAVIERGPLPTVVGDLIQLTRLFQNLLMNSIRYRSGQPPCIRIEAENRGHEWLFSVQDNGIGIEPQYAEKVFGIFKRLHGHGAAGTGIGLAICKKIVTRHGGRIWVDSKLGAGATFYFTLPALPQ